MPCIMQRSWSWTQSVTGPSRRASGTARNAVKRVPASRGPGAVNRPVLDLSDMRPQTCRGAGDGSRSALPPGTSSKAAGLQPHPTHASTYYSAPSLPRALLEAGYRTPGEHAHYPQGLLSCLLRLQSRLPVDFDLCAHTNERTAALAHLKALAAPDLVVYDRGYYCFELLCAHLRRGLHAVFRLSRNICPAIDGFIDGDRTDTLVRILPGPDTLRDLSRKYPGTRWRPVPLRLVKYTHATTTPGHHRAGPPATASDLADLYHARWGIEEMYKISQFLEVDQFHGQRERLVKQELYADRHARLFTNRDADRCQAGRQPDGQPAPQANFKHSLAGLAQHLEGLLLPRM